MEIVNVIFLKNLWNWCNTLEVKDDETLGLMVRGFFV